MPRASKPGSRLRWSFRAHLVALVLACVLPLAGLGFYSMMRLSGGERMADRSRILGTAHAVSSIIDQQLRDNLKTLRALAMRFPRESAGIEDFYGDCAAHAAESGGWITLLDPSGEQVFNTKRPLGAKLPRAAGSPDTWRGIATMPLRVSNLFTSSVDGQANFAVVVPIVDRDKVTHLLAMTFPARSLSELLAAQRLPAEWTVTAVDREGTIFARNSGMEQAVGTKASADVLAMPPEQDEAFFRPSNRPGASVYLGVARSPLSGWKVVIGIPKAIVDAPLEQSLQRFAVLGGAVLLLAIGAAWLIGRRLATNMKTLAGAAYALARHQPMPTIATTVREVDSVASALSHAGKELVESERQLRRGQEHLLAAQHLAVIGSIDRNLKTGDVECTDETFRLFGVERASFVPTAENLIALVHEQDRERVRATAAATRRGVKPQPIEYRIVRPDGEVRTLCREAELSFDTAGEPARLLITVMDVTELRAAEERLRHSQQHLLRAQRVGRVGSIDRDLKTGEIECTDETFHLFGVDRDSFVPSTENLLAMVHPDDRERAREMTIATRKGIAPRPTEYRVIRPDGEIRILRLDAELTIDEQGEPSRVFTTYMDVTELRATEERLRRSQQHLLRAQRIAGTGSIERNLKTGEIECTDEIFRIMGVDRASFVPTTENFLKLIHEEDRDRVHASRIAAARGLKQPPIEYRFVRPDGDVRMVYREAEPTFDQAGEPIGLFITIKDVTDLRAAEQRQRDLERQLQHAQKIEALGTLAGGIAHDLNNTLVPILGLTKLMMKRLPEDGREHANLATILRAGERARDLVRRILAFSRKDAPIRECVDIAALVRDSLKMIRASIPATIHIAEAIGAAPPVLGDPGELHQVVINLVVNAAQSIGGKLGTIGVTLAAAVPLPEEAGRAWLRLTVRDTGCGMDAATLPRIFEPFFTTKPVGEGTGLGLSMVHGIVVQHGGKITVESEVGQGTRFDVYLPSLVGRERPQGNATAEAAE